MALSTVCKCSGNNYRFAIFTWMINAALTGKVDFQLSDTGSRSSACVMGDRAADGRRATRQAEWRADVSDLAARFASVLLG